MFNKISDIKSLILDLDTPLGLGYLQLSMSLDNE